MINSESRFFNLPFNILLLNILAVQLSFFSTKDLVYNLPYLHICEVAVLCHLLIVMFLDIMAPAK